MPGTLVLTAEILAADARLLLEAGRLHGAALLQAEACILVLRAWLSITGADPSISSPRALPPGDAMARQFRAVWLDRPDPAGKLPTEPDLRAMADGLRGLVAAVRARATPEPAPSTPPAPAPAARPSPTSSKPARPRVEANTSSIVSKAPAPETAGRPRPTSPKPASPRTEATRPPLPLPASPPAARKPVSSAAFWSLIDRWGVDDRDALALVGHAGGLTKRGTRPRFRLGGNELERYQVLQTLDDALAALGVNARDWLRAKNKGSTPLAAMLEGGEPALRETARQMVGEGLRKSLK